MRFLVEKKDLGVPDPKQLQKHLHIYYRINHSNLRDIKLTS